MSLNQRWHETEWREGSTPLYSWSVTNFESKFSTYSSSLIVAMRVLTKRALDSLNHVTWSMTITGSICSNTSDVKCAIFLLANRQIVRAMSAHLPSFSYSSVWWRFRFSCVWKSTDSITRGGSSPSETKQRGKGAKWNQFSRNTWKIRPFTQQPWSRAVGQGQ